MARFATFLACFVCLSISLFSPKAYGSVVTGNPMADGWSSLGHSLANGVYTRGTANYGFEIYGASLTVSAGSMLEISDGSNSWLAGDTVLGYGGAFTGITAADAGWAAITGTSVNSLLSASTGPALIVKFGTSAATYSPSTIAPGSGNGVGSTAAGGSGTVFVRTSAWFHATDPVLSQDTNTTWSAQSGQLMPLDKANHISRTGTSAPDAAVARVIWEYDAVTQKPSSWQILLNVSLLDRTAPVGFTGLTPAAGDLTIISVQNGGGDFTDSVVAMPQTDVIPEPGSIVVWSILSLAGMVMLRRKLRRGSDG